LHREDDHVEHCIRRSPKEWCARKKKSDLEKALQLFDDGRVLEAAKLGLPVAQGQMAKNNYAGQNGFCHTSRRTLTRVSSLQNWLLREEISMGGIGLGGPTWKVTVLRKTI
jgi:hypothetical protein